MKVVGFSGGRWPESVASAETRRHALPSTSPIPAPQAGPKGSSGPSGIAVVGLRTTEVEEESAGALGPLSVGNSRCSDLPPPSVRYGPTLAALCVDAPGFEPGVR